MLVLLVYIDIISINISIDISTFVQVLFIIVIIKVI